VSDMWIHEGWTTYLEALYVEYRFGRDDALRYINGYKPKIRNRDPIITQRGVHRSPNEDQYFKGALFLNTLRSVVADDDRWWKLLHDLFQHFKYRNILTEDIVQYVNAQLGKDFTAIFNQYLRRSAIPTLELSFNEAERTVAYRWKAEEREFAMPVMVGRAGQWLTIEPATSWKVMALDIPKEQLEARTDLFYVNVSKF